MKLLILFTVSYYTFRCNIFVVKKHLSDSEIFSLDPTKRVRLAIIMVLVNGVNVSIIVIIVNNIDVSVYFSLGFDRSSVSAWAGWGGVRSIKSGHLLTRGRWNWSKNLPTSFMDGALLRLIFFISLKTFRSISISEANLAKKRTGLVEGFKKKSKT